MRAEEKSRFVEICFNGRSDTRFCVLITLTTKGGLLSFTENVAVYGVNFGVVTVGRVIRYASLTRSILKISDGGMATMSG